jgi:hypothetical protein
MIFAAVAITIGEALRDREPRCKGKSLGAWLHEAYTQYNGHGRPYGEAVEAIKQIGTNAIPFLLTGLRYETPQWQHNLISTIPPLRPLQFRENERPEEALLGFHILGEQAKGTIPELTRALAGTNRALAYNACCALGWIGKDSIPVLLDCLTNRTAYTNGVALSVLLSPAWEALGPAASTTLSVLLAHLDDKDIQVARASTGLLGTFAENQIGADAIIIPALIKGLDSTNAWDEAANSLRRFKGRARPALPRLTNAVYTANSGAAQSFLIYVINGIDPQALKQLTNDPTASHNVNNAVH